uniref:Uncharacterized protein n=1 Tax=Romanomermis culicivorax TaxID=13658 RepID=A0A915K923_ROMCU
MGLWRRTVPSLKCGIVQLIVLQSSRCNGVGALSASASRLGPWGNRRDGSWVVLLVAAVAALVAAGSGALFSLCFIPRCQGTIATDSQWGSGLHNDHDWACLGGSGCNGAGGSQHHGSAWWLLHFYNIGIESMSSRPRTPSEHSNCSETSSNGDWKHKPKHMLNYDCIPSLLVNKWINRFQRFPWEIHFYQVSQDFSAELACNLLQKDTMLPNVLAIYTSNYIPDRIGQTEESESMEQDNNGTIEQENSEIYCNGIAIMRPSGICCYFDLRKLVTEIWVLLWIQMLKSYNTTNRFPLVKNSPSTSQSIQCSAFMAQQRPPPDDVEQCFEKLIKNVIEDFFARFRGIKNRNMCTSNDAYKNFYQVWCFELHKYFPKLLQEEIKHKEQRLRKAIWMCVQNKANAINK